MVTTRKVVKPGPSTLVKAPVPKSRSKTTTTSTKTVPSTRDVGDELASQLDRTLMITQPKAGTSSSRTTAVKTKSPTKAKADPPNARSVTTTTKQPSARATTKNGSSGKGKEVVSTPESSLVKSKSEDTVNPRDRAQSSMVVINDTLKSLSAAIQSGYRYSSKSSPSDKASTARSTTTTSSSKGENESWTDGKVVSVIETGEGALNVLRELNESGVLGFRGLEIERAAQALVSKCLGLGMHRRAMDLLVRARPFVSRLYDPKNTADPPGPLVTKTSSSSQTDGTKPKSTSFRAPVKSAHSRSSAKIGTSPTNLSPEWLSLASLPVQKDAGAELAEPVRTILFQFLISTWICLIILGGPNLDTTTLPLPTDDSERLHPFTIAVNLPLQITTPLLHMFSRTTTGKHSDNSSSSYLHFRILISQALSTTITVDSNQPSKNTPSQLWASIYETFSAVIHDADDADRSKETSEALGKLVDWTEKLVESRSEPRHGWFQDKSWLVLMELWTGLGRRLGDSMIIDRALALMMQTASTSADQTISVSRTPTAALQSTQLKTPASMSSLPSFKGKQRAEDAEKNIYKVCGELAKTVSLLNLFLSDMTDKHIAAINDSLDQVEFKSLVDSLLSLEDDETGNALMGKAYRAVERVRQACLKIIECPSTALESSLRSTLLEMIHSWLEAAIALTESVISAPSSSRIQATSSLVRGTIDTLVCFARTSSSSEAMQHIERIGKLCKILETTASPSNLADYWRCLASAAHHLATRLWKEDKYPETVALTRDACQWSEYVLKLVKNIPKENDTERSTWASLEFHVPKRYELLGAALSKTGEKAAAMEAFFQNIASQPATVKEKLSAPTPLSETFAGLNDLEVVLKRITQPVVFDPLPFSGFVQAFEKVMNDRLVPSEITGAVAERLLGFLEEGVFKEEVREIMQSLADLLLGVYDAENFPIRRLRAISIQMGVIISSGQSIEKFPGLIKEVAKLTAVTSLGKDKPLSIFKEEILATCLIYQTLQAYHDSTEPSLDVASLATSAIPKLRQLALPPSSDTPPVVEVVKAVKKQPLAKAKAVATKAPPRTPARGMSRIVSEPKVGKRMAMTSDNDAVSRTSRRSSGIAPRSFDDLPRLIRLLGHLASLLGLLGHVLPKIETLKIIRTLQRNREDQLEAYIEISARLASQYAVLGKRSRATTVFNQAIRHIQESRTEISPEVRVELYLRQSAFLAASGEVEKGCEAYNRAQVLAEEIIPSTMYKPLRLGVEERCGQLERAALAREAMAAIYDARNNASAVVLDLSASFRLRSRAAEIVSRIAPSVSRPEADPPTIDDPFTVSAATKPKTGHDEPSKDSVTPKPSQCRTFSDKHLSGIHWRVAEGLLNSLFNLATAFAERGSVKDCDYFLSLAGTVATSIKSSVMVARVAARLAELQYRLRNFDVSAVKLEEATMALSSNQGPDEIDVKRIRGEAFTRQDMLYEAKEVFTATSEDIAGLDADFVAAEALMPSPKKNMTTPLKASVDRKEPLLPIALAHVLQQQAWLLRDAGSVEQCSAIMKRLHNLSPFVDINATQLFLEGKIALRDAFDQFKTDLFMSSLTESSELLGVAACTDRFLAISMPMGKFQKSTKNHRHSTRVSIDSVLQQADRSFLSALALRAGSGRVEDVRQACLSLALLRAFQTSLGQGSSRVTASAAGILASSSAITLQRELLDAIDCKFPEPNVDDLKWPIIGDESISETSQESDTEDDRLLRSYWSQTRSKHAAISFDGTDSYNLDCLPSEWAVISINVTEDRNTMFISRHQRSHEPLVFCLPLDRQGKREGEDDSDIFTFEAAAAELKDILSLSEETARGVKSITTQEEKNAWWATRTALDQRMGELLTNMEYCWLGAFKTILSPRGPTNSEALQAFDEKLERIFIAALADSGSDVRKGAKVQLNIALLECFSTLSSKARDEEIEDLVYFILDIYQFHGVPVALAELDIDQIGIDVRAALTEFEMANLDIPLQPNNEHIFLALDKNVQCFAWESIPILRGRAISRIPSLPFLLDQVSMGQHLGQVDDNDQRQADARKTFYILNSSGDLVNTQERFEPWLKEMESTAGWRGIIGRSPTELEMIAALKEHDLVLYIGHGGAQQYIRSHKIRHLPQCATTMLWGCSSGKLLDQGDLDRTGTAWNYVLAGCPSLVANLWDVTDRDIDRLSGEVLKKLYLDPQYVSSTGLSSSLTRMSTVQAVNASREDCRMKYLTGAAPVVYGIPVYFR